MNNKTLDEVEKDRDEILKKYRSLQKRHEKFRGRVKELNSFVVGRYGETCLDEHTTCECDVCQIARKIKQLLEEK